MNGSGSDIVVCGGEVLPFGRHHDSTPRDWLRSIVPAALADAGIEAADVDSIVLATESDHLSLQLSPGALIADELGLNPCAVVRVEAGGASGAAAVRQAVMQLASKLHRCVLVLGFEHAATHLAGDDVRRLYGLSFDADVEGFAGVTPVALYALSFELFRTRFPLGPEHLAAVVLKNRANAIVNPWAHRRDALDAAALEASPIVSSPYRRLDCSPLSDGAAAMVLMRAADAPQRGAPRAVIRGTGSASDRVRLGDRDDPGWFAAKARAMASACAMAGITSDRIDVAEVYDAFSGAELQAIAACGLAEPATIGARCLDGDFGLGGSLVVNPSGGLLGQGAAPGATGIVQVLTLARVLTDRYWHRPRPSARWALADAHGGIATVAIAHVLERVE